MPRFAALASAAGLITFASAAAHAAPPYLKLAQALGTPSLANAVGPADRSRLLLDFVRRGETMQRWSKLTAVSIVEVDRKQTQTQTHAVIDRFRRTLAHRHVRISTFDLTPVAPYSAYFDYQTGGERDAGIAYSPAPGFVTIAELAEKKKGVITNRDLAILRSVIGRR